MITVLIKFSPNICSDVLQRQLKLQDSSCWEGINFTYADDDRYDWLVVMHHSALQRGFVSHVPKDRCIYISMEPSESMCNVTPDFWRQFGTVISSDPSLSHPNLIRVNVHSWWVGLKVVIKNGRHFIKPSREVDYHYLKKHVPGEQLNKISVIYSGKVIFPGHFERNTFIDKIKESRISEYIDVYGNGGREFSDKLEVLEKYKYHLVIENMKYDNYWTEKIADVFLAGSRPIYFGCENIENFFPHGSVLSIDINNFDRTVDIIENLLIGKTSYFIEEKLAESKNKILNDYNFFNVIYQACNTKYVGRKVRYKIYPNTRLSRGWLYFFAKLVYLKISQLKGKF